MGSCPSLVPTSQPAVQLSEVTNGRDGEEDERYRHEAVSRPVDHPGLPAIDGELRLPVEVANDLAMKVSNFVHHDDADGERRCDT